MNWMHSLLLAIVTLSLCGCMSWTRVPIYEVTSTIKAEDTVRLKTMDGEKMRFVVTDVEGSALVGKDVRVQLGDIDWIEKGKDETLRNIGIGAATVAGVALAVGLALAVASLAVLSSAGAG